MPFTIELPALGSPDVLVGRETAPAALKPGEVRIAHTAIGFNYLDVYLRTGVYPIGLPTVLGVEAAGRVMEVGAGVTGFAPGDRVAYAGPLGAYASERTIDAAHLIPIPDGVEDEAAAALLFKGLTAHMLLRRVHPVALGDAVLIHAAAGGVGQILIRWAKALGATVIATVGSAAKIDAVRALGADHVFVQGVDDVAALVRDATGGLGVAAVYDSVGRDTFETSLAAVRPFGTIASYGLASGEIAPVEVKRLRSVSLIRPSIYAHIADPARYRAAAVEVFDLIRGGTLTPTIGQRFPLREAAAAHRMAEGRATVGATLLIP